MKALRPWYVVVANTAILLLLVEVGAHVAIMAHRSLCVWLPQSWQRS